MQFFMKHNQCGILIIHQSVFPSKFIYYFQFKELKIESHLKCKSGLWRFIVLAPPWSFSTDVIVSNSFFINSGNPLLRCLSQALIRFVECISFNSCGTQISSFFTSPRLFIYLWTVDFGIFNFSLISRTVTEYQFD